MTQNTAILLYKSARATVFLTQCLLLTGYVHAVTPYAMSAGDYSESFSDIANWANNFASGTGAVPWASYPITTGGTANDGIRTTKSSSTFVTVTAGGIQKGSGALVFLSTGSGTPSEAVAVDLLLDFTGRNAGSLSFDWIAVDNSSGTRPTSLRIFWSIDNTTFTELTAAQILDVQSPGSGTISAAALPAAFNDSATARLRFYNHAGAITGSGNRDKISVDNVAITSTAGSDVQPSVSSVLPASAATNAGNTVTFTVSATGGSLSYFWYKQAGSSSNLIASATTSKLTLANVLAAAATNYWVTVSNSVGTASSSAPVSLSVVDPAINTQPASQTRTTGATATFAVAAGGTPTLTYQWYQGSPGNAAALSDGGRLSGATSSSFSMSSLANTDATNFFVVIGNSFGSVTSSVATLTVVLPQLARWDFNATNTYPVTAPQPASGNGTASLVGGVTGAFVSGSTNDPNDSISGATNAAWSTTGYPGYNVGNKSAGALFAVDTTGFSNIVVRWEQRHSGSASRYTRFQYTVDGANFVDDTIGTNTSSATTSFAIRTNDLSSVAAVNNNPNFAFRIVSEFESTATGSGTNAYAPTTSANYDTGGTIRFDLVTVFTSSASGPTAIPLQIQLLGSDAVLTWTNSSFNLQAAPAVDGTFTNVDGATSPHTNPATGAQKYFRLKNP